jgi:hypothetical protein
MLKSIGSKRRWTSFRDRTANTLCLDTILRAYCQTCFCVDIAGDGVARVASDSSDELCLPAGRPLSGEHRFLFDQREPVPDVSCPVHDNGE